MKQKMISEREGESLGDIVEEEMASTSIVRFSAVQDPRTHPLLLMFFHFF